MKLTYARLEATLRVSSASLLLLLLLVAQPVVSTGQVPSVNASAPEPTPDSSGAYPIGNGVSAPKPVSMPDPDFSEKARKKKIAGRCRLSLVVGLDGRVRDVRVVHSISEDQPAKLRREALSLDEKAMEAVQQYRFEPGVYLGKPVPVAMTVEINFQIF